MPVLDNPDKQLLFQQLRQLWQWADPLFGRRYRQAISARLKVVWFTSILVHRYIRAAIAEIEGGSSYGLPLLTRPILEALINLDFISVDPAQAERRAAAFLLEQDRARLTGMNKMIELLRQGGAQEVLQFTNLAQLEQRKSAAQASIDAYQVQEGITRADWPIYVDQRARTGGNSNYEEYVNIYWNMSHDTHAMPMSLTARIQSVAGDLYISPLPQEGELEAAFSALISYYIRVLQHLEQHAGFPAIPQKLL